MGGSTLVEVPLMLLRLVQRHSDEGGGEGLLIPRQCAGGGAQVARGLVRRLLQGLRQGGLVCLGLRLGSLQLGGLQLGGLELGRLECLELRLLCMHGVLGQHGMRVCPSLLNARTGPHLDGPIPRVLKGRPGGNVGGALGGALLGAARGRWPAPPLL